MSHENHARFCTALVNHTHGSSSLPWAGYADDLVAYIGDVIVPAFPGMLLLSQWIATKAILGKTGTNHIPVYEEP